MRSLEDAQAQFPLGISIGKLGVATAEGRPPRLVVDSSVLGLNGRCKIPEKSTLPTAREIVRSFPIRGTNKCLSGFSLDVKSAHKRIVLHPDERGLVGFSLEGPLYFYYVTPFGAVFSATWWSRLGGFILRCFHHLIWMSHAGFLYVDDFLFFMDSSMMPLAAALLCIFSQITGIPISWRKTTLGPVVDYIGWEFNFHSGIVIIPAPKNSETPRLYPQGYATTPHFSKIIGKPSGVSHVGHPIVPVDAYLVALLVSRFVYYPSHSFQY